MSADCIFCKIVAGDLPGDIVAESELSVAFRDLMPQAPTHVLVVPRSHHENAAEVAAAEPQALADMFLLARTVAEQEGLEGYRAVFNTGAAAQQTVFHAHLHVLGGRPFTWPPG
ncbi:HIT domain-containing protein [Nocardioides daejeonensis]|uniref:HIT domain-containing protein n=1 Tax=Nocardioides daejeonensis TaxID=1046556 RepID=UPI000D7452A1|nr:HIT domain-containing protein [Nocardioides daejeonensis]